ncbi:hypothetical protein PAV_109p00790 (plasmid) [Paenibacillus alvei DSM 29]|nr:hypothetical protein [Paenibacillus alvei]EJW13849.1 hypothetical protein PAV_109p00790 [Paenibacillus alvei DSM 29]
MSELEASRLEESRKRAQSHKVKFYVRGKAFSNDHIYFIVDEDGKVYKILWESGSRLFKHIEVTLDHLELVCDEVDVNQGAVRSALKAWEKFKERGYVNIEVSRF